ncbi:MAG: hypothetical protein ACE5JN_16835 [Candidatus Methylomirabilia bacterium]
MSEVKRASCAVGNEVIILPDDVQPGDVIECHGVRQRVTYEFGAYALVRLDRGKPASRTGEAPRN